MQHEWVVQIRLTPTTLTVALTELEKVEALHGDVTVPRTAVSGARVVPDGTAEVHGLKIAGTGLTGVVKVGTWQDDGTRTFAVCHGRHPAVVITLCDQGFDRLVVSSESAGEVVAELGR